jgi:two-component system CheB/CheR fusion protein
MPAIRTRQTTLQQPQGYADHPWSTSPPAAKITDDVAAIVFVIDSSVERSEALRRTLEAHAFEIQVFSDSQSFLKQYRPGRRGCLLVDVSAPETGGIELIKKLKSCDCRLATIAVATRFAPARVVEAMKAGASDCLERPITTEILVAALERVLEEVDASVDPAAFRSLAIQRIATLTARQREVLDLITTGHPSKNIAADLRISQRTVENHRAAISKKTCSRSLSDVVHTAICANCSLMKLRH